MKSVLITLLLLVACPLAQALEKPDKLVLAGPFASVSNPLVRMVESGALADMADEVELVYWRTPDQMRAMILNKEVDFIATPTNVAANLYNRGADIRLLNVSVWGILWLISREEGLHQLADFRGKEIVVPFRGDMPDIVFRLLANAAGLDPDKDFKVRYAASPLEAMQWVLMRRADHALLAEPAVSMALHKSTTLPVSVVAPTLYRSLDLQQEWGRLLARPARIPQAGMVLVNTALPVALVERFTEAYQQATQWCLTHPEEAGVLVAERVSMLAPEAVSASLKTTQLRAQTAQQAKAELQFFFDQLLAAAPALVGDRQPADAFYYQP